MNYTVAIILDGEFGERLHSIHADAIWVADSPTNVSVVNEIRRDEPECRITTFRDSPGEAAAAALAAILPTVELHHGPHSQDPPYDRLEVYGCRLNSDSRAALADYELDVEGETPYGFAARVPARHVAESRQIIIGLLDLISDPDDQRKYEAEVPIASVPGELICMWFDDHYHPSKAWFIRAFSASERRVLEQFAAFYRAQLPHIRRLKSVADLHAEPRWTAVMNAAREARAAFPGESGNIYPAADRAPK